MTTMPSRKYKPKPPISALDDAAAQHRRQQSCKAQRAYRQRKEDAIATLTLQIKELEDMIDKLSACFLGLNNKILQQLGHGAIEREGLAEGLTEGIRDSMKEFKGIIESVDGEDGSVQVARVSTAKTRKHDSNDNNGIPTPPGTSHPTYPPHNTLPSSQLQLHPTSSPQSGSTIFSGPAFYGLTPQTLPLHRSTPSSSPYSLAHRIYTTTIARAFSLLQTVPDNDPVFRRVFEIYFTAFPEEQVRGEVARMMMSRDDWNPHHRPQGTEVGWWSALQVAAFVCSRGWRFNGEGHRVFLSRREEGGGDLTMGIERFLDDILIDARCAWDTPEYREDTVVRVVLGMEG